MVFGVYCIIIVVGYPKTSLGSSLWQPRWVFPFGVWKIFDRCRGQIIKMFQVSGDQIKTYSYSPTCPCSYREDAVPVHATAQNGPQLLEWPRFLELLTVIFCFLKLLNGALVCQPFRTHIRKWKPLLEMPWTSGQQLLLGCADSAASALHFGTSKPAQWPDLELQLDGASDTYISWENAACIWG